jgi:hypothetical protein
MGGRGLRPVTFCFSPLSPPEMSDTAAYATRAPPVTAADPRHFRRPDFATAKGGRAPEFHFSYNHFRAAMLLSKPSFSPPILRVGQRRAALT